MSHSSFEDLDRRGRRRVLTRAGARVVLSATLLFVAYFVSPGVGRSAATTVVLVVVGVLLGAGILGWEVRRIMEASYPNVRAAEAIGFLIPAVMVSFAYAYLCLSQGSAGSFSEKLNHIGALYFTISTMSTVGFGDIVARTNAARVVVMLQILVDLALVFGIGRTIFFAARVGRKHRDERSGR